MSQKKRVRVIPPQVNTDHFANYMFQVGGPVGQGPMAPMQQAQDISQDLNEVLQMYAQAVGMDEQQLQQLYTQIMQMEPDQQAQAVAQMQQELNSTMAANPMVKNGGDIKSKKKLLNKKIGGANTNMTSSSLVDQRKQTFKDAVGANMARDLVNQVTEEKLSEANNMMGYASNMMAETPTYDYGGYTNVSNQGMGYASREDNPFYNAMTNIEDSVGDAWNRFGSAVGNIGFSPSGNIKVKRRGDIFNNPSNVNPQVNASDLTSNEAASQMFGLKNGGGIPSFQTAGTYKGIDIGTGYYDPATKTITATDGSTKTVDDDEANWIMSQVSFGSQPASTTSNETTTNNNQASTTTTGSGVNGWHGGFYWQNGVPVTSIYDIEKMQQQSQSNAFDVNAMFQPGARNQYYRGDLASLASNPAMLKQFGKALTNFQPDNVHLSKVKGRVNPFGAKVVLKWDYDENGRPVQKEVVEGEEETSTRNLFSGDRVDNIMNRFRSIIPGSEERFQKRTDRAYERYRNKRSSDDITPGQTSSSIGSKILTPTGGSGMESVNETEYTPPNPVYDPVNYNPRTTMETQEEEFAYGGMPKARAGKMVIKEKYTPDIDLMGQAISPAFDMVSSLLEQRDLNQMENRIYTPDAYVGSIPMGNMSMGTKGLATLTGKENRFGLTANYGDALYQNIPGYELSGQIPNQPLGKYGGMYQPGGSVTPSEFYNNALKEKQYFLDNPDMWKEDPEMQNPDGTFNLCLDCLNVDYSNPSTVEDVVRLINEGHSQYPHLNADTFTAALQQFGITPPTFGSAQQKKYGGSYQVGGTYELSDDEIDDIINRGGEIEYY